jgi:O-antigen ligase
MAPAYALADAVTGALAVAVPVGELAEKLGTVSAAGAVAAALLLPDPRRRALATAAALALASGVLVGHIWNTEQFRSISGDAGTFVALLALGVAVVAALALLFLRRPQLFPLFAVAALPFRVPIEAAGATSNLLVPLYLVVAGAAVAHVWRELGPQPRAIGRANNDAQQVRRPPPSERTRAGSPVRSGLELAIAAFIVLYVLQALYSSDFDTALEQTVFFYVPFALLLKLLAEVRWTGRLLLGCVAVLVVLALAFSGIGFWEYERRELLWNPKVISANQFESYFRVNSVFWDPNVFGRFLALVMVLVTAIMLWTRRQGAAVGAAIVLGILWGGLVLTFSQSSIAALLIGLAVLAALRWDARRTAAVSAVGLALGVVAVVGFQDTLRVDLGSSSGLNKATSGRADLIEGGADLFLDRPLWGYGSGSFGRTFRRERKGNQAEAVSASHTLPVTIAAEQGLVGLALYAVLLVAAFRVLLGKPSVLVAEPARGPPALGGRRDGGGPEPDADALPERLQTVTLAALTAAFATLVTHTMMYAAFLEDPFTWVIVGIGLGVARRPVRAEARAGVVPAAEPAPAAA